MQVDGEEIEISSPDKILFPESKITKEELVDYYVNVAPYMVPHLENRPLTMIRYPQGIGEKGFFQKEASEHFPDYIKRVKVKLKNGEPKVYATINNAATLAYLANMYCIPMHNWLSRKGKINHPDMIIWDLDPSDTDFEKVRKSAFLLKDFLANELGLTPFIKTSGSRGLHVTLPIVTDYSFTKARNFALKVSEAIVSKYPELMTVEMQKKDRGDKVFVDYLRNAFSQSAVAPYSVREKEGAPVAMPISWEELKDKNLNSQSFNIKNSLPHLKKQGDLWKDLHKKPQKLEGAMKKLKKIGI